MTHDHAARLRELADQARRLPHRNSDAEAYYAGRDELARAIRAIADELAARPALPLKPRPGVARRSISTS